MKNVTVIDDISFQEIEAPTLKGRVVLFFEENNKILFFEVKQFCLNDKVERYDKRMFELLSNSLFIYLNIFDDNFESYSTILMSYLAQTVHSNFKNTNQIFFSFFLDQPWLFKPLFIPLFPLNAILSHLKLLCIRLNAN